MSVSEYEDEPVRGLPGYLPDGETVVWQGSPDRKTMARRVFHIRQVSIYVALLLAVHMGIQLTRGSALTDMLLGSSWMLLLGLTAIGILAVLAWAYARATIYTLTDKRLVIRCGVAMPMMVNIPLSTVEAADMRRFADGAGDIVLTLDKRKRLSYLLLWPNVKPWVFSPVQPALRSLSYVDDVAEALAEAVQLGSQPGVEAVSSPAPDRSHDHAAAGSMLGAT